MGRTKISKRKWLYLPIETKVRELYGKILLACFAAENGWGVIIGSRPALRNNQKHFPKGTFIEKSIPPKRSIKLVDNAKANGHKISAWCEEGLVYLNSEDYGSRFIEPKTFYRLDHFFTWGERATIDLLNFLGNTNEAKKIIVTSGNPRFDLLHLEFRKIFHKSAQKINNRYGKIILLNTGFWLANNALVKASDNVKFLKEKGHIKSKEQEDRWIRVCKLQDELLPHFLKLPKLLSEKFPEHTIIVRTHPSEIDDPWIKEAKNLTNVKVIHKGNVDEWIVAADVIIENNCTTGIESFLLNKPAISYRPYKDEGAEFVLPNSVSFHADNENELVQKINYFIENPHCLEKDEKIHQEHLAHYNFAKDYIANIKEKLASETILETLETLDLPLSEGNFPIKHEDALKRFLRKIKYSLPFFSLGDAHLRKKFPDLKLKEVRKIINEFQEISNRFSNLEVVKVDDDAFCIYRKSLIK